MVGILLCIRASRFGIYTDWAPFGIRSRPYHGRLPRLDPPVPPPRPRRRRRPPALPWPRRAPLLTDRELCRSSAPPACSPVGSASPLPRSPARGLRASLASRPAGDLSRRLRLAPAALPCSRAPLSQRPHRRPGLPALPRPSRAPMLPPRVRGGTSMVGGGDRRASLPPACRPKGQAAAARGRWPPEEGCGWQRNARGDGSWVPLVNGKRLDGEPVGFLTI